MSALHKSTEIKVKVSDALYGRLIEEAQRHNVDVSTVVERLLSQQLQPFDLTQTETWQLCGAFTVTQPDPAYVVGRSEIGQAVTNYAEHVNSALYLGK